MQLAAVVDHAVEVIAAETVAKHDAVRLIGNLGVGTPGGRIGRRRRTAIRANRTLTVAGSPTRQRGQRGRERGLGAVSGDPAAPGAKAWGTATRAGRDEV